MFPFPNVPSEQKCSGCTETRKQAFSLKLFVIIYTYLDREKQGTASNSLLPAAGGILASFLRITARRRFQADGGGARPYYASGNTMHTLPHYDVTVP